MPEIKSASGLMDAPGYFRNFGMKRNYPPKKLTKEVIGQATWFCAGVGGKDAAVKLTGMCSPRPARGHAAYPAFGLGRQQLVCLEPDL
jgi:hypothetical protein